MCTQAVSMMTKSFAVDRGTATLVCNTLNSPRETMVMMVTPDVEDIVDRAILEQLFRMVEDMERSKSIQKQQRTLLCKYNNIMNDVCDYTGSFHVNRASHTVYIGQCTYNQICLLCMPSPPYNHTAKGWQYQISIECLLIPTCSHFFLKGEPNISVLDYELTWNTKVPSGDASVCNIVSCSRCCC